MKANMLSGADGSVTEAKAREAQRNAAKGE